MSRPARLLFVILCSFLPGITLPSSAQSDDQGFYSRHAKPIWSRIAGSTQAITFPAPDGRSSAKAGYMEVNGEGKVMLQIRGRIGSAAIDLGPGVGSELLWAPDSNSIFVITSDEGANGSYRTVVIGRLDGQLQARDLTPLVANSFGHPVKCEVPEIPNVGGVSWSPDSRSVLVAAEIVNHTVCDSAGTFRLFQVNPWTMTVLRSFGQLQAKRQFGLELGIELLTHLTNASTIPIGAECTPVTRLDK